LKLRFKKIFKWGGFLLFSTFVFFLGMYAYKNESIRSTIFSVSSIKNISYSNYKSGQNCNPKSIELIIPDSSKNIINQCRKNAIKDGILRDKNKIQVPGKLVYANDTFKIELRLKGDYSDHWIGDKQSYRIKIKGEKRFLGMKSFSIQNPSTRNFLSEWYYHKLLKEEDLIALRYGFLSVNENGIEKGIYAIEESFDKQVIENNNRKNAPILKFDESILIDPKVINESNSFSQENLYLIAKIDVFKSKRTLKNPFLYNQYMKGKSLLEKLRRREISLSDAIDVDKAAKLFAISDLIGGHHGLRWKNVRFYFNPSLGELELIGFDSNSGHHISDIYYNLWSNKTLGVFDVHKWKDIFFEDEIFVNTYFTYLEKYSNPNYLRGFHEKISPEMNLYLTYLYKENSMYKFFLNHYTSNAQLISEKVEEYKKSKNTPSKKYFVSAKATHSFILNESSIQLKVINNSTDSIVIFGLFNKNQKVSNEQNQYIIGRQNNFSSEEILVNFTLETPLDSNQIRIKRKGNKWVYKSIKIGYKFLGQSDTIYTKIEHYYPLINNSIINSNNIDFYTTNHAKKTINIHEGIWNINKDFVTPMGYSVICKGNTTISLTENSTFIINGDVQFIGSKNNPIIFTSADSSGTLLVYQSAKESNLNYVMFKNLSESHNGIRYLSGAVNFYEANVSIKNVKFVNNHSEDALNIVRSKFNMDYCTFEQIESDAFDGDFCSGSITNSAFKYVGNDAIDFSGSQILLSDLIIENIGDKGISVGEKSKVIGKNINISYAELGLVSKDLSYLKLSGVTLSNTAVPYAVFQKKEIFGPAILIVNNSNTINFKEKFLLEPQSIIILNKIRIKSNYINVSDILYGKLYGKSSK